MARKPQPGWWIYKERASELGFIVALKVHAILAASDAAIVQDIILHIHM